MGIGDYKYRITFRSYTSVADTFGGTIDTPVDVLDTWAKQKPLRSNRGLTDAQLSISNTTVWHIRYRKDFLPNEKMKIVCQGKEYVIQSVVEIDADHKFWEITAIDQTVAEESTT